MLECFWNTVLVSAGYVRIGLSEVSPLRSSNECAPHTYGDGFVAGSHLFFFLPPLNLDGKRLVHQFLERVLHVVLVEQGQAAERYVGHGAAT